MTGRLRRSFAPPLVLLLALLSPRPGSSAEAPAVLEPDRRPWNIGLSVATGYAALDSGNDASAHLLLVQLGLRSIFFTQWEVALDLRANFDPAQTGASAVHSYDTLVWLVANVDLLPLVLFVGVGGGAVLEDAVPSKLHGTVGACLGLALWFEATWRLVLRGAQRWVFRGDGSVVGRDPTASSPPFLPTEVLLAGEYFF